MRDHGVHTGVAQRRWNREQRLIEIVQITLPARTYSAQQVQRILATWADQLLWGNLFVVVKQRQTPFYKSNQCRNQAQLVLE